MGTNRLEAFSDGVLAIIITIMVLELKVPHGNPGPSALFSLWPVFSSYILSFIYVGIYWNNHHHMLQASDRVTGAVLWANLHLLFWLSLLPFTTGWMGENEFGRWPTALYGVNLLCCALAYFMLERLIIAVNGKSGILGRAVGLDLKGKISPLLYLLGIGGIWLIAPWVGIAFFAGTAALWLIPDRRIERLLIQKAPEEG
jgi:uncharacterized membrane protein